MQGVQVTDNRYNVIDKAVGDMAGGTVKLRHIGYALVAFLTPLAIGMLAMGSLA
ncbi:hypothetical protein [Rhodovibrio salinarum]|uniref:hypothetical protein n=1 Tax=Rhodovibrio salinarum TaxID=1087 RepID=UPI0004BC423E|nr:hypothetical protein [Rhodovibrio salinarum]